MPVRLDRLADLVEVSLCVPPHRFLHLLEVEADKPEDPLHGNLATEIGPAYGLDAHFEGLGQFMNGQPWCVHASPRVAAAQHGPDPTEADAFHESPREGSREVSRGQGRDSSIERRW